MLNTIFNGDITIVNLGIMILTAVILGILNSFVYSVKNVQSKSFSLTLILLPLISAVIIFMVNDHLGVGVAVAGAFTLVRFRSTRGSGREITAIFSSMALGLLLGMGYVGVAVIVFCVMAIVVLLFTATNLISKDKTRYLRITIPEDLDYEGVFSDILQKYTSHHALESVRTKNMGSLYELQYAITMRDVKSMKTMLDDIRVRNGNLAVQVTTFSDQDTL